MAERVLAHRPGDHLSSFIGGGRPFAQGDFEEGAELLSRALDHHPNELSLWRLRRAEHDEQALLRVEALEQLHRLDPTEERSRRSPRHMWASRTSARWRCLRRRPAVGCVQRRSIWIILGHLACLELLGAWIGETLSSCSGRACTLAQALTDPWSLALVDLGLDRMIPIEAV